MPRKSLSVIIPCFHKDLKHYSLTQRCIENLKKYTPEHKLIIVENLQTWCEGIGDEYINSPTPKTYAQNINIGLCKADTDYVCSLNNDVFLCEGWYEAIMECFRFKDCGVACLDSTQYQRPPKDEIIETFFGALWVAKKEVIDSVGLFDETFIHAFDDADYWVRVYQQGYKILMNRRLQVEHKDGSTIHAFEGHTKQYVDMRMKFNDKYKGCNLPIFERLR